MAYSTKAKATSTVRDRKGNETSYYYDEEILEILAIYLLYSYKQNEMGYISSRNRRGCSANVPDAGWRSGPFFFGRKHKKPS